MRHGASVDQPSRQRVSVGAGIGLACAVLMLGPGLAPGYLLFYDMVFVPDLSLSGRVLGVDGSVPRAVPNDLVVAVLSGPVPGWLVQKAILVTVFVGVGAGVARLTGSRLGALTAAAVACWNPYVAERLAIGHWGFLLGYACLPWVAHAAARCRTGDPRGRFALATSLLLTAATGSTGSVLALILTVTILLWPKPTGTVLRRRVLEVSWVSVLWLLANAPWWWPFLRLRDSFAPDPGGVDAFASRSDTAYGVLPSLLTGGGIWNRASWFEERMAVLTGGLALILVCAALVVWVRGRGWTEHPAAPGLSAAGVLGLAVAAASALPGGEGLIRWVVTSMPGGGLLRDSQKFLALWMLLLAVAAAFALERLRVRASAVYGPKMAALALAMAMSVAVFAALPGPAWGAGGRWASSDYPPSQLRLAARLERAPEGAIAVFPWTLYRRYAWNDERVVLDPWQRLVSRRVLVNDALPLSDRVVRGEDPDAAAIGVALRDGDPVGALRERGVRYALVLTDQPAGPGVPDLSGQPVVARAHGVRVHDLGAVSSPRERRRATDYVGLGLAALAMGGLAVLGVRAARTGAQPRRTRASRSRRRR